MGAFGFFLGTGDGVDLLWGFIGTVRFGIVVILELELILKYINCTYNKRTNKPVIIVMKSDWTGLRKLQRKVKKLDGSNKVAIDKLFSTAFMVKFTQHSSIDDFFDTGGFEFETEEEFDKIPEKILDKHVRNSTRFSSWEDMLASIGWLRNWVFSFRNSK